MMTVGAILHIITIKILTGTVSFDHGVISGQVHLGSVILSLIMWKLTNEKSVFIFWIEKLFKLSWISWQPASVSTKTPSSFIVLTFNWRLLQPLKIFKVQICCSNESTAIILKHVKYNFYFHRIGHLVAPVIRNLDNYSDNDRNCNYENSFPVVEKSSFRCNQRYIQFACWCIVLGRRKIFFQKLASMLLTRLLSRMFQYESN